MDEYCIFLWSEKALVPIGRLGRSPDLLLISDANCSRGVNLDNCIVGTSGEQPTNSRIPFRILSSRPHVLYTLSLPLNVEPVNISTLVPMTVILLVLNGKVKV